MPGSHWGVETAQLRPCERCDDALGAPTITITAAKLRQVLLIGWTVLAAVSGASALAVERDYAIGARDLSSGLRAYSLQSGQDLVFDPALVRGKTTAGVIGHFTDAQALERLLQGTGLKAQHTPAGGMSIVPAVEMPTESSRSQLLVRQTTSEPQPSPSALDEVAVTATRRSEPIQAVPMSITAVTATDLRENAATTFFDYASAIPNLSFGYAGSGGTAGFANSRQVAVRGIAGSGTTGFYIDDTPVPASIDLALVDVSRVEVLRGPQGTLYGALSMGGTVRMLTEQPDDRNISARAHGSLSDTELTDAPNYQVDGALNVPLIEGELGIRISGVHEESGGNFKRYAQDTATTIDNIAQSTTNGAQAAVLWQPIDTLSITPRVLYQRTHWNGFPLSSVNYNSSQLTPIFIQPGSFSQAAPFNIAEGAGDEWTLSSLDIKYKQRFGILVLSSSYFKRHTVDSQDETVAIARLFGLAPLPASVQVESHPRYQIEELRFSSTFPGPFQVVAGLYYQHLNTSGIIYPPNYVAGLNAASGGAIGTDLIFADNERGVQIEKAPYAEANYDFAGHARATVGLRETQIETSTGPTHTAGIFGSGPTITASVTQKIFTPKYSLQYRFSPENQLYATAAKGFRPGTEEYIPAPLTCAAELAAFGFSPGVATVAPDTVWSYELGAKTGWLDQRVTADVAAFRINWSRIQENVNLPCGASFLANGGKARSQGGELVINARITDHLSLQLSGGFDDATFTTTLPGVLFKAGDRIPQVPRESFQIGINYTRPIPGGGVVFGHLDYRAVADSWSTNNAVTNAATGRVVPLIRPAYHIADARVGVRYGPAEYALFAKNLTNEVANLSDTTAVSLQAAGISRVAVNQPRTIGVEVRYRFH
ncbi:MAG: TonB-dependent receptor [Gammaproteobacteria bacterium]|jgi:iron complex outermembrane receptor protein|nr:TonB-dependent receptor [Gammaproteobacteria bacterium]